MTRNKIFIIAAIVIGALIVTAAVIIIITVCSRHIDGPSLRNDFSDSDGDKVMLIDYCKKTVATVGGDGYRETVLYQNRDGTCEVHYYSKFVYDEVESHSGYTVDSKVIEDAYAIINRHAIVTWNDRKFGSGPDGAVYILKFRGNNGEYTRVTSNNCPENGISVMSDVVACLRDYADEGEKIENLK